jgi:nicotinic acid mononucleotide adenylyltransferase
MGTSEFYRVVEALPEVAERGPGTEFFFIMGAGALSDLGTWR